MEQGLSIPIILKFSIFTKLILARDSLVLDRCVHWKHKNTVSNSVFIKCKECIYYHSYHDTTVNIRIYEFFHKRSILNFNFYIYFVFFWREENLFEWKFLKGKKNFIFFRWMKKISTIRNIQLLLFQHIENYIFHSSHFTRAYIKFYRMWYIYRNIEQDITLSTSRCYFSQYIIVQ